MRDEKTGKPGYGFFVDFDPVLKDGKPSSAAQEAMMSILKFIITVEDVYVSKEDQADREATIYDFNPDKFIRLTPD